MPRCRMAAPSAPAPTPEDVRPRVVSYMPCSLNFYVATTHSLPIVQAEWGQVSVLQAQRLLLQEALADPANQVFQLMDAFTVPLYPPLAVYAQLMGSKSRIDICSDEVGWPEASHN